MGDGSRQRKKFRVAKLILMAFEGSPEPGMEVAYVDGNRGNTRLDNLTWFPKVRA
jgi:hypothetical protein